MISSRLRRHCNLQLRFLSEPDMIQMRSESIIHIIHTELGVRLPSWNVHALSLRWVKCCNRLTLEVASYWRGG